MICVLELTGSSRNCSQSLVVSGSGDSSLRVWDIDTGSCMRQLTGHEAAVSCVSELPDGNIVSSSFDKSVRIWDITSGNCTQQLEYTAAMMCVAGLSNGRIASGSMEKYDNSLLVWD